MTTKIWQGSSFNHRSLCCSQSLFQKMMRIRTSDRVHCVERHPKSTRKEPANRFEVKQLFHQFAIILQRIDYVYLSLTDSSRAFTINVDVCIRDRYVLSDLL